MKNLFLVLAAVGLSSMIKCEAKALFFFPFHVDYKKDKTNDHLVKTFVYSSPLSGKTYNFDYTSNWAFQMPPGPPPPMPVIKSHAQGSDKTLTWDVNWSYNHGSSSGKVESSETTPTSTTTTTTTTTTTPKPSSGSHSGNFGHKKIDVKWSFDYNSGGSSTQDSSTTTEKSLKPEEDSSETKKDDEKNDIDPTETDDN